MNTNLRHISYCLIASLLFVACRKESHPITPEEPEEQYAISMNAASVTDMTTSRALVTDDADLQVQGTNLGVFAYKELADGTKVSVFDNERIYYTDTDGWKYDNTKYWDKAATEYCFVAYYPYLTDNIIYNKQNLTISNIPCWQTIDGSETDYLVANSNGSANYYLSTDSKSVPLDFKHILCQLEVRVAKNAFLSSDYTLSNISYTNVPKLDEKAVYTFPEDASNGFVISQEAQEMVNLNNVTVPSDPDENTSTTIKHLVVPFNASDNVKVTLAYKVNDTPRTPAVVDTNLSTLQAGKRYVLTLIFNSGADIETSLEILDWVDEDVDEDKYNW